MSAVIRDRLVAAAGFEGGGGERAAAVMGLSESVELESRGEENFPRWKMTGFSFLKRALY